MKKPILILICCFLFSSIHAQQVADTTYNPPIHKTEYQKQKGPVVFIDEGHYNFHTKDGRYTAFSRLLERDGYKVKAYKGAFNKKELSKGKILVISNALNEINVRNWYLPNPSAFSKAEIEAVKQWVAEGGSLFLIADHMPMGGAAKDLAAAFDFEFTNGFAFDTVSRGPGFFSRQRGTLADNVITKGRNKEEKLEQVVSFTGQAFKIPKDAKPILLLDENYVNFLPDTAWVFNERTRRQSVKGWSQGAFKIFGKGKVVAFGEAAMFSAQLAGPQRRKMGMNNEIAPENYQLLLNIIHWLDGRLEE
ncbi:DUF4350 domain-containing protein [Leptobacterium flavescens]|uniref:DUF4350 domain-containing protein n=1 Tax=Leptobacterium flavescens TaxID=472055 RepID=A0A6P0UR87_9FLAO|nr:DUF4350 domain-containing protein [Leptobacterium flavescens]NER15020.1 DUF4350 domain-containing protein [Leptobacterium flavescens]